jgi:hypothetical protein
MWDAGKKLESPSYGPGKPCSRFRKCPCGEIFDMHGPDEYWCTSRTSQPRLCQLNEVQRRPPVRNARGCRAKIA